MKILSFQHKSILDQVLDSGEYRCTFISNYRKRSPICYETLGKRLLSKTGIDSFPIFGWYDVLCTGNENLEVNKEVINRALEMVPLNPETHYLFELDIPEDYVELQDFYSFASIKLDEEENTNFNGLPDILFDKDTYEDIEVQATFPLIRKEWIKSVYEFDEEQINFRFVITKLKKIDLDRYSPSDNSLSYSSIFDK